MFSTRYFYLTTVLLSILGISTADFDINAKTNVAIYYGQGPNESVLGLKEFCTNSNVDIIPLGFLDIYPAQGNGYPGTNFASSCTGTTFSGPGYNGVDDPTKNDLQNNCPTLVDGISFCQGQGKKILLSLGGAPGPTVYQLTSDSDAEYLADFLWGAFGPLQADNTWPRPFDDAATGSHTVDGFDFDIERIQPGEQQYYITMINRLIGYFPTGPGAKKYLITGAPQCIVPDANMGEMIAAVPFDILFVQYYNTDTCSARSWITANPNYPSVPETKSGFGLEFAELLTFLSEGASKNAKVYFGLPGASAAANAGEYLDIDEATKFLEAYFCQPSFGGVMVWEGIYAYNNIINGQNYQNNIKSILSTDSTDPTLKKCPASTPTYTFTLPTATPTPTACVTCTKPHTIVSGDTCSDLWTSNGISSTTFYSLNPNIDCGDLQIGQIVCCGGSVGSCTTPPTVCVTCTKTHTVVSGDTCSALWTSNNIPSTTFYALNPNIDCGDLQIGQSICVGGNTHPCTTSTTHSSTSTTHTTSSTHSTTSSTHSTTSPTSTTHSTTSSTHSTTSSTHSTTSSTSSTHSTTSSTSTTHSTTSSTSSTHSTTSSTSTSSSTHSTTSPTSTTSSTHSTTSSTTSSSTTSTTSSSSSSSSTSTTSPTSSTSSTSTSSTSTSSSSSSTTSTTSTSSSSSSSSTSMTSPTSSSSTSSTTSITSTSSSTASSSSSSTTSPTSISSTSSTTSTISSATSSSTTSSSSSSSLITSPTSGSSNSTSPTSQTSTSSLSPSTSPHLHTSFGNSTSRTQPTSTPVTYTLTTTSVYTVTSCPPTVTNCPIGHVTTDVLTITTTYCPGGATSTPKITASPIKYTTSVVYTTLTYTITACPATVTNCPALGSATTETKALYTTVCPIGELPTPGAVPASTAPGVPAKEVSVPIVSNSPVTTLNFSPVIYSTVPKPSSSTSSFAVVYQTMSVMPVAPTSASGAVIASASPVKPNTATFTGSAAYTASLGIGGVMTIILCVAGWALV